MFHTLDQHYPEELSVMLERYCICADQSGVATNHLKCGQCDRGTKF